MYTTKEKMVESLRFWFNSIAIRSITCLKKKQQQKTTTTTTKKKTTTKNKNKKRGLSEVRYDAIQKFGLPKECVDLFLHFQTPVIFKQVFQKQTAAEVYISKV